MEPRQVDGEDEAGTSSTEDMSDGSQDTKHAEPHPARTMPHLSLSFASSSSSLTVKDNAARPDAPIDFHAPQSRASNGAAMADGAVSLEDEKKREHKRRSKNWTRAETLKLIETRTELEDRFRRSGKKGALWEEIACALQREKFARDCQQCKDKWEKLTAGYKEVRDGTRDKEDHPFYNELHRLLGWKPYKKEAAVTDFCAGGGDTKRVKFEDGRGGASQWNQAGYGVNQGIQYSMDMMMMQHPVRFNHGLSSMEMKDARPNPASDPASDPASSRMAMKDARPNPASDPASSRMEMKDAQLNRGMKQKREETISLMETGVVQELVETIIKRQQSFLTELMDMVDRKEQLREQTRYAREERWRAEERAQRYAFSSAMIRLTHGLLGERPRPAAPTSAAAAVAAASTEMVAMAANGAASPKKRSKNWKRSEVSNLIRVRHEMEGKFVSSVRRAGLWDELGEKLASLGINRDGKQCREKWDKLMAEYKDVMDGRKDRDESIHFSQLTSIFGDKSSSDATKDDCAADA